MLFSFVVTAGPSFFEGILSNETIICRDSSHLGFVFLRLKSYLLQFDDFFRLRLELPI